MRPYKHIAICLSVILTATSVNAGNTWSWGVSRLPDPELVDEVYEDAQNNKQVAELLRQDQDTLLDQTLNEIDSKQDGLVAETGTAGCIVDTMNTMQSTQRNMLEHLSKATGILRFEMEQFRQSSTGKMNELMKKIESLRRRKILLKTIRPVMIACVIEGIVSACRHLRRWQGQNDEL